MSNTNCSSIQLENKVYQTIRLLRRAQSWAQTQSNNSLMKMSVLKTVMSIMMLVVTSERGITRENGMNERTE